MMPTATRRRLYGIVLVVLGLLEFFWAAFVGVPYANLALVGTLLLLVGGISAATGFAPTTGSKLGLAGALIVTAWVVVIAVGAIHSVAHRGVIVIASNTAPFLGMAVALTLAADWASYRCFLLSSLKEGPE